MSHRTPEAFQLDTSSDVAFTDETSATLPPGAQANQLIARIKRAIKATNRLTSGKKDENQVALEEFIRINPPGQSYDFSEQRVAWIEETLQGMQTATDDVMIRLQKEIMKKHLQRTEKTPSGQKPTGIEKKQKKPLRSQTLAQRQADIEAGLVILGSKNQTMLHPDRGLQAALGRALVNTDAVDGPRKSLATRVAKNADRRRKVAVPSEAFDFNNLGALQADGGEENRTARDLLRATADMERLMANGEEKHSAPFQTFRKMDLEAEEEESSSDSEMDEE